MNASTERVAGSPKRPKKCGSCAFYDFVTCVLVDRTDFRTRTAAAMTP